jgi:hypothetical protein
MDQKLRMFEVFRRSLGRAGMCWNQLARVDHMCKKWREGGKKTILAKGGFRAPGHDRRVTASCWPATGRPWSYQLVAPFFFIFFYF